jgi:hypothetical protein
VLSGRLTNGRGAANNVVDRALQRVVVDIGVFSRLWGLSQNQCIEYLTAFVVQLINTSAYLPPFLLFKLKD